MFAILNIIAILLRKGWLYSVGMATALTLFMGLLLISFPWSGTPFLLVSLAAVILVVGVDWPRLWIWFVVFTVVVAFLVMGSYWMFLTHVTMIAAIWFARSVISHYRIEILDAINRRLGL